MKSKITLFFFFTILSISYSQNLISEPENGQYKSNLNETPCLTTEQRLEVMQLTTEGIEVLRLQNRLAFNEANRGTHPLFVWPVDKASNVSYNDVWAISNYVDHNPVTPNALSDYNCGPRTYDTTSGYNHQGIDIFSWPFTWHMMDNDYVEIVAAAPGQIIAKNDGQFDRSCDFNSNFWNAVYVQHSDGSIAWYGHLKNGSQTSKNVGDMVSEGEFLGVMGSSGNSTGPHLHFEVWSDATYTQLVDPYVGACNTMNSETWWQSQKPYVNPGINAVLTHSDAPVFPGCPTQEITNISDQFGIDDTIYFGLYLRDQVMGEVVSLKIIRPDNSILYNWNYTLTATYYASWLYWFYQGVYNMEGEWKWEATYNGETVTHSFNIGSLSIEDESLASTSIFPNPSNDIVNISSTSKIKYVKVFDVLGKRVLGQEDSSGNGIKQLNLSNLSKGVYFIKLEGEQKQTKTIKLIKK
jgi:murein DD-endopeptidase MepM/ murein hydrolase activator NlpD